MNQVYVVDILPDFYPGKACIDIYTVSEKGRVDKPPLRLSKSQIVGMIKDLKKISKGLK